MIHRSDDTEVFCLCVRQDLLDPHNVDMQADIVFHVCPSWLLLTQLQQMIVMALRPCYLCILTIK